MDYNQVKAPKRDCSTMRKLIRAAIRVWYHGDQLHDMCSFFLINAKICSDALQSKIGDTSHYFYVLCYR